MMKVKLIATGESAEFNDEYACRLIEQGKAVPAPVEAAPEEKAEEPEAKKPRKK